jgi:hypothetical protein
VPAANKSYNQRWVMSTYKSLSLVLRLVTVDRLRFQKLPLVIDKRWLSFQLDNEEQRKNTSTDNWGSDYHVGSIRDR